MYSSFIIIKMEKEIYMKYIYIFTLMFKRQFYWGGILLKSNGGEQRYNLEVEVEVEVEISW